MKLWFLFHDHHRFLLIQSDYNRANNDEISLKGGNNIMRGPGPGGPGGPGGHRGGPHGGGPGGPGGFHGGHHMPPPPPPRHHRHYGRYGGGCLGCCMYLIGAVALLVGLFAMIF